MTTNKETGTMIDELVDLADRWDRAADRAEERKGEHLRRAVIADERARKIRSVANYYREKALAAVGGNRGPLAEIFGDTFALLSRHVKVGR